MSAIDKIYSNEVGMSFFWKKNMNMSVPKIQIIFRDTGFLLTLTELKFFSECCNITIQSQCRKHCTCHSSKNCRSLLLRTPSDKVDLAVNQKELNQIHQLIDETIFRVELKDWIRNLSLN
ncbi:hypothetical protein [Aquimarina algicola]|uniref:Uncharacterized protein n=1 Tax=Aquimarina algicola TaxID=2589995 RepID=A0A504JLR7_9FLAO|nr:hypothetical protein [Aquimarina algicola]TPN87719.1 hypothetical protein FHK87_09075 [Aquimarina algicola]